MNLSENGLALVKHFEGCNLTAADDGFGVLTIGYGHTNLGGGRRVTPGLTITQAEAEADLREDMQVSRVTVMKLVTVPLTQNQFDALVSFEFNCGSLWIGSMNKPSSLLTYLNGNQLFECAQQFDIWNHVDGKVVPGLSRRRHAERDLFCGFGWERWKV